MKKKEGEKNLYIGTYHLIYLSYIYIVKSKRRRGENIIKNVVIKERFLSIWKKMRGRNFILIFIIDFRYFVESVDIVGVGCLMLFNRVFNL